MEKLAHKFAAAKRPIIHKVKPYCPKKDIKKRAVVIPPPTFSVLKGVGIMEQIQNEI